MQMEENKPRNIYKISPLEFKWILNKITDIYKADYWNIPAQIDSITEKFTSRLCIKDRLGKFEEKCA